MLHLSYQSSYSSLCGGVTRLISLPGGPDKLTPSMEHTHDTSSLSVKAGSDCLGRSMSVCTLSCRHNLTASMQKKLCFWCRFWYGALCQDGTTIPTQDSFLLGGRIRQCFHYSMDWVLCSQLILPEQRGWSQLFSFPSFSQTACEVR